MRWKRFLPSASVEREACPFNLVPTASTTVALALGDALAIALLEARGFRKEDFARYHPGGAIGRALLLTTDDIMRTGDRLARLGADATVRDAVFAMTEAQAGAVVITSDDGRRFYESIPCNRNHSLSRIAVYVREDAKLADSLNMLAARWIDEVFADADDHSVPVAVFSCRTAQTGVTQADELIKIEEYSAKAKFAKEIELQDENTDTGMAAAENLYITDPEIQVFLTAHNGLALGINNYFTGLSSPVTDYSGMGIFCVNGNEETGKLIKASADGETPFRGMVLTGGVQDTCNEIRDVVTGIYSGELPSGTVTNATTVFVNGEVADEYLESGMTSITLEDFGVEEAA